MTIPEGFAQITVDIRNLPGTARAAVVFGVSNLTGLSAGAVAVAAQESWEALMALQMTVDWRSISYTAKLGPDDTGAFATQPAVGGVGQDPGPTAAPNAAYLLEKNTDLGGRRGRGRMYLPGVSELAIDDEGVVNPAKVTDLNASGADLLAGLELRGTPMVVLHDPATIWVLVDGQPRRQPTDDPVPAPTVVESLVCDPVSATQRRRLR